MPKKTDEREKRLEEIREKVEKYKKHRNDYIHYASGANLEAVREGTIIKEARDPLAEDIKFLLAEIDRLNKLINRLEKKAYDASLPPFVK